MFVYPSNSPWDADLGRNGFAVVDLETSGLAPNRGDRIVELAIVRCDANGSIQGVYSTLVNPGPGKTTGPAHIHRISDRMVAHAPTFDEIAPCVLAWIQGAVVVAHNARFEDGFLSSAFHRMGMSPPAMPALDTLDIARSVRLTSNNRLSTLAAWAGVDHQDAHTAEADARATAAVLARLLRYYRFTPTWDVGFPALGGAVTGRYLPRPAGDPFALEEQGYAVAHGLRKGTEGWIANLLARLPDGDSSDDAAVDEYLQRMATALEDGRITGDEARELAILAGSAGLSRDAARVLNRQILDGMLTLALEDDILTSTELNLLRRAAAQLDERGYFDHLVPTVQSSPKTTPPSQKMCGKCGRTGHNRRTCTRDESRPH